MVIFCLCIADSHLINNPESDPRELKRALIVKMDQSGTPRSEIKSHFNVIDSFISRWSCLYIENNRDASVLLLGYKGRKGYLTKEEKQEILTYLEGKNNIQLIELKRYIEEKHKVIYKSDQSYYELLNTAKMSWKKTQKKTLIKILKK